MPPATTSPGGLARPRRGRRDGGPVRHPPRPRHVAVPLIRAALGRYSTGHRREMALYWSFLAEAHLRGG